MSFCIKLIKKFFIGNWVTNLCLEYHHCIQPDVHLLPRQIFIHSSPNFEINWVPVVFHVARTAQVCKNRSAGKQKLAMTTSSNGNISRTTGLFCEGNSPVTGEFPPPPHTHTQMPVTRSFDVFFDLHLNKRLSKHSRRRWLETPSRSLCRHCKGFRISWVVILHPCC